MTKNLLRAWKDRAQWRCKWWTDRYVGPFYGSTMNQEGYFTFNHLGEYEEACKHVEDKIKNDLEGSIANGKTVSVFFELRRRTFLEKLFNL